MRCALVTGVQTCALPIWFIDKASSYATQRQVFGRPIGQNQGVQFPIARAYAQSEAAALMVERAAALFDAGQRCGKEANMAKMLASEASWAAAEACLQTHGGFGFAAEYRTGERRVGKECVCRGRSRGSPYP